MIQDEERGKRADELVFFNEMRQFVDTANATIFSIDREGSINEWNLQAEKVEVFT
jgi:PAS domain-containing protein